MKSLFLMMLGLSASLAHADVTPNDPIPTKLLSCGGSVITQITGRLEGDTNFSTGTEVVYRNGTGGVSYDKVDAIVHSRVGDHVLVCLVWVPKNCPPGDNRGKTYTVTNLRTLESWTLPDAEHMCGGA
jgi:hypothetical protein